MLSYATLQNRLLTVLNHKSRIVDEPKTIEKGDSLLRRVTCPNSDCRRSHRVPEALAGQAIACPDCGTNMRVPNSYGTNMYKKMGQYMMLGRIGQGASGSVFNGFDTKNDRPVAIKVLKSYPHRSSDALIRFYREARAAQELDHPHLVKVYDMGVDRDHHFLVMELIEGKTALSKLKRLGGIPAEEAVRYTIQVANAAEHALSSGIIHRDIKPSNILINNQGETKLADFGLAKVAGGEHLTLTGQSIGTPQYMAPEQIGGSRDIDHRADIYSLGVTLLHMLAAKSPYEGESAITILYDKKSEPVPSATEMGVSVSTELEAIIRRMCAKVVDERYQDYPSLIADLESVTFGQK
jgi:serine/threonine protein kinase